MTRPEAKQTTQESIFYEVPRFERHDLATITLGGSPGAGDSGAPDAESPFGSSGNRAEEKPFKEGWDDEG